MTLTFKMDNLEQLVTAVIEENINNLIEQEVRGIIANNVKSNAKEIIENIVNEKLVTYVEDYIKTATVSVGGGWNSQPVVYSVEEYIKHQISEIMESGKLHTKSSYGNTTVTFEEFIKQQFDATSYVKKALEAFMKQVKDDINKNVDDMFNQTTKAALSSVVMNLLSNNATFVDMQNNIRMIANG